MPRKELREPCTTVYIEKYFTKKNCTNEQLVLTVKPKKKRRQYLTKEELK